MYVYAEDIFALNFVADILILGFVFKYEIKAKSKYALRIFFIAVAESILTVVLVNKSVEFKVLGKISLLLAVAWTASCEKSFRVISGNFILITVSSFVFCGAVLFVGNGLEFVELPVFSKLICFAFGCALAVGACFCFDRCIKGKIHLFLQLSSCEVSICGKKVERLTLFADTGNLLKTVSGQSIIVIDEKIFKELCGLSNVGFNDFSEMTDVCAALPEDLKTKAGFKFIKGIGQANIFMTLKTDFVKIDGRCIENAQIMPGNFAGSGFDGVYNPIFFLQGEQ